MKIAKPILPIKLEDISLEDFQDGDIETALLQDADATNIHIVDLQISEVAFERNVLTSAQLERASIRDFTAKQCDFSAAHITNGNVNRAEFNSNRMPAVDFNKTTLHDVTFKGCKLDMANFRFSDLRRVKFTDCTFTESDFLGATLHDVSFESCTLEKTVFDQAKCKFVDLRTSDLIEISGWMSLKGATIDSVQLANVAPYLANELGLTIRNT